MPLRDHFRPPLDEMRHWEGLHGGWPMMIVASLRRTLPRRYFAEPLTQHDICELGKIMADLIQANENQPS